MGGALLYRETRGNLTENIHTGTIAVVDGSGRLTASVGDAGQTFFYRSASKPIQALPTLARGLDLALGASLRETAVFAGSHLGDEVHLDAVLGLLGRAGFPEDDLIMKPAQGRFGDCRKAAHTCSGKHACLMLLARALCGDHRDYWRAESAAQQEVLRAISAFSGIPAEEIGLGVDGCGVPVFAVPLQAMALSFLRLACPDLMEGHLLAPAARRLGEAVSACPEMIRGEGSMDTLLNTDPNLIAKSGRFGVYCIGFRRERLGVALKIDDGDDGHLPPLIACLLRRLGYDNRELLSRLDELMPLTVTNDLGAPVGEIQPVFQLS